VAVHSEALSVRGATARSLLKRAGRVLGSIPFLGIIITLCTWQEFPLPPGLGLDPSWGAGLQMAVHEGLVFGRDVVFTYGPFGFLSVPTLWFDGLGSLAFAYSVLVHFAACTLVLWAANRIFARPVAFFVAILASSFLGPPLVLVALFGSVSVAAGWVGGRIERLFPFLIAVLAAFGFLVKVNFGVEIVAIGAVALLASPWPRSLSRLAAFAATFVASLLVLWLLAGQPLGALPDYVSLSNAVISGHSEAMPLTEPGPGSQVIFALVVIVGFVVATWMLNADQERRQRVMLTLMIALFGFFSFKEGFVRQDDGHIGLFASAIVSAWFVLGWKRELRWPGIVSLAVVLAVAASFQPGSIDPIGKYEKAQEQITTMLDSGKRHQITEEGRHNILTGTGVEANIVSKLPGSTVHLAPYETTVAWALGVTWKPLPIFQDYLAYRSQLDRANADMARSSDGPDLILQRVDTGAIDGRYSGFNAPEANLAILCHYSPEVINGEWMLLRKGNDRCGAERPLGEAHGNFGEPIAVPQGPPNSVVVARVHGAEVGGLERIRSFLFRAKPRFIELITKPGTGSPGYYRLVPGTAQDGLIMSAPANGDYPRPFAVAPQANAFVIAGPGLSGPLDVEFEAVPIRPLPDQGG
jgi:hypothetical protein